MHHAKVVHEARGERRHGDVRPRALLVHALGIVDDAAGGQVPGAGAGEARPGGVHDVARGLAVRVVEGHQEPGRALESDLVKGLGGTIVVDDQLPAGDEGRRVRGAGLLLRSEAPLWNTRQ